MATSWIELSEGNLKHNLNTFKSLASGVRLFAVVKGNAYGHGQKEIVSLLEKTDISGYMVFELEEALNLNTSKEVFVLADTSGDLKLASSKNITLPVLNYDQALSLSQLNLPLNIHIKVDIGTGRIGLKTDVAVEEIQRIAKLPNLQIRGIFSHFADSENKDTSFTKKQFRNFQQIKQELEQRDLKYPLNHVACSAAILQNSDFHQDGVRLGLSLYGLWPSEDAKDFNNIDLKPVLAWKTEVLQVKKIKPGEGIGYGQTWKADKETTIATLPIGYYDGYDRLLSNTGEVSIQGQRCKVRGRVCMNLTMVEVPDSLTVKAGDEVTLIGQELPVEELASKCSTINYEFVTRLGSHIPRKIVS